VARDELAEKFLSLITAQEIKGSLDMDQVALYDFGQNEEFGGFKESYKYIKESIYGLAHDICLHVVLGELINRARYSFEGTHPEVKGFRGLDNSKDGSEDNIRRGQYDPAAIIQQAREQMEQTLETFCKDLPQHTARQIADLFYYKLEQLGEHQEYDGVNPHVSPSIKKGEFFALVEHLLEWLKGRVLDTPGFVEELDKLRSPDEANIEAWYRIIVTIEAIRNMKSSSTGAASLGQVEPKQDNATSQEQEDLGPRYDQILFP
jgi:hypothetical protein